MKKKRYLKELEFVGTLKRGSKGVRVRKLQQWLKLYFLTNPYFDHNIAVDGDFGRQTAFVLSEFQAMSSIARSGVLDRDTWTAIVEPMRLAFLPPKAQDLRTAIVEVAQKHLYYNARELSPNIGPWVRAYMDGNEGRPWAWCVGAYATFLDQAIAKFGKNYLSLMPGTYSCDIVGARGLEKGTLIRNKDLKREIGSVKPGDAFLIRKSAFDWVHIGLIVDVDGDYFHTIEGNSNDNGDRDGYELCRRMRKWVNRNIDVYKLSV